MNILGRLRKLESRITPGEDQYVWDFTNTTDEQLHKLIELHESNKDEAVKYSNWLIDKGFLSYQIIYK